MLDDREHYVGREQTLIKHLVLRKYLERFGHIIGFDWDSITYVDGFSGPWKIQSDDLSDTSFSIALRELRKARDTHAQRGRRLDLRCVFLERDQRRFADLKAYADGITDAKTLPLNSSFEQAIPAVIRFLDQDRNTFPFVFIDPTGWSGFSMETISPLLRRHPCEVLINFMLDFVRRFIEHDYSRQSFVRLFGSEDFDEGLKDLQGLERDDAIADRYCRALREVCGFDHVQRAIVLHPHKDQSHFLLIYGTRHHRGIEVFKDAEKKAMKSQEASRARLEVERKKQPLLDPDDMPDSRYYIDLRAHYESQARTLVKSIVESMSRASFDRLWFAALSYPLVWESDLKAWLRDWRDNGMLEWHGLAPRQRALRFGESHSVSLTGHELS